MIDKYALTTIVDAVIQTRKDEEAHPAYNEHRYIGEYSQLLMHCALRLHAAKQMEKESLNYHADTAMKRANELFKKGTYDLLDTHVETDPVSIANELIDSYESQAKDAGLDGNDRLSISLHSQVNTLKRFIEVYEERNK